MWISIFVGLGCPLVLSGSLIQGTETWEIVTADDSVCGNTTCALNLLQRSAVLHHHDAASDAFNVAANRHMSVIPEKSFSLIHLSTWLPDLTHDHSDPPALIDGLPAGFVRPAKTASWICTVIYALCVMWDVCKVAGCRTLGKVDKYNKDEDMYGEWSIFGISMLCFYRLYTGFLAATWLPYVLAMEGEAFWPNNQSLFMGIAKLIYGITVLMNPMFGLLGDMLAEVNQGAARRLWILLGLVLSAFGILVCLYAGPRHEFYLYMTGIAIWRLGESLNDVTTEAMVPELVPTRQFALASSIKAASFLLGGLLGYILLFFLADVHYTWCYYAYLACMFTTAIPSLILLDNDSPCKPNPFRAGKTFCQNMSQAYITPMCFDGGFPEISFAIFIMSCGTAPMFFFLLIIRDLLGVHNGVILDRDFALGSMIFFLCAAAATVFDVTWGGRVGPSSRGNILDAAALAELSPRSREENRQQVYGWEKQKKERLGVLVVLSLVYASVVALIPIVQVFPTILVRFIVFYPLVVLFGGTFGIGYSRFQDATWRLLPAQCDMANAMGFNVMSRNFGLGVGNFLFGALLEAFKVPQYHYHQWWYDFTTTTTPSPVPMLTNAHQVYTQAGYDMMCIGCMIFNVCAGFITWRIRCKMPDPEILLQNMESLTTIPTTSKNSESSMKAISERSVAPG